jgi:hypothetical protein
MLGVPSHSKLAAKVIVDFYTPANVLDFYTSTQDNETLCVSVMEGVRLQTYEVLKLAKRIIKFKKRILKGRQFA